MSRPTLALGGQLKGTFALGQADRAILSHHLGDLDDLATYQDYQAAIAHYCELFGVTPARLVHDLHPGYASTTLAMQWARDRGLPSIPVQHHHAHMASCLAEHGHDQPVIGVIFDGTGYGTDGTVWGGEFLVGDCAGFRRAGHLRTVRMPGGEAAIREPWRMAAAHGLAAGLDQPALAARIGEAAWRTVVKMTERGLQSPETSSMGRLFDAVAAIVGLGDRARYEGQAAMALEALASGEPPGRAYAYEAVEAGGVVVLDPRPLIRAVGAEVASGVPAAVVARRFHSTVVAMIAEGCGRLRETTGLDTVALSGGVFQNALVLHEAAGRLERAGFRVLTHRRVPPNDGGLALGQLAVAAAREEA